MTFAPDPRWQMNTPVPQRVTTRLPSGLELVTTQNRTAILEDRYDALSARELRVETAVAGDPPWVTTYTRNTRTLRDISPEGRETVRTLDSRGRLIKVERSGLEPMAWTYDEHGRVATVAVGTGAQTRTMVLGYRPSDGYLGSVSGPLPDEQVALTERHRLDTLQLIRIALAPSVATFAVP